MPVVCVEHGVKGFIVEQESSRELADALASLQADAVMSREFARRSLAKVRSFGLDRMVDETFSI